MREALSKEYGLGPMKEIEPELDKNLPNPKVTPMGKPNITKSSRQHRDEYYGAGVTAMRLAKLITSSNGK